MAQKSKPAQSKSDPVVEQLQKELKQQGFFPYDVDGVAGEKTTNAQAARDAARQRDKQLEIDTLNAQGGKTKSDAEAAALSTETERKKRYDDQSSSALGLTAKSSANLAAPAAGTALGMALGKGVNYAMDQAQNSKNSVLQGIAADRMSGKTTVEGARTGAKLAGAMPLSNPALRTASRMAPHAGLGLLSMGKGAQVLHDSDPNGEFYAQQADRAAGLGYIGVGAGLTKQGLRYAASPGVAPDGQAIAVINSNQIRRNGAAGAPQVAGPDPGTKMALLADAKAAGITGISRMNKGQLAQALLKAGSKAGAFAGPAAAGALAMALTPERAEAADGSGGGNLAESLTNAGVAGGVAAGTGYGMGKLAQALGPMAGPAMGTAGAAMAPMSVDSMTDYSPDELAQSRNWLARNLPQALQGGAVANAREMAQVPTRGPLANALMAGR